VANYAEMAEFDKAIFFYTRASYADKTSNDTFKTDNNNLGNIYCFEKKSMKRINFMKTLKYSRN
jgi:hypothetical protein